MQPKLFGKVHVHMYSWQVDLNVPRHITCRFVVYTVHNFLDCNLNILACDPIKYNCGQHLISVGVDFELLKPRFCIVHEKKRKLCNSSRADQIILNRFINLLRV